jgi:hypothetical protein
MIDLDNITISTEIRSKSTDFFGKIYNSILYYNTKDIIYRISVGSVNLSKKMLYLTFEIQYNNNKVKLTRKYYYKDSFRKKTGNNYMNIPKKYRELAKELFILFEDIILLPEKLNRTNASNFIIYKDLYN